MHLHLPLSPSPHYTNTNKHETRKQAVSGTVQGGHKKEVAHISLEIQPRVRMRMREVSNPVQTSLHDPWHYYYSRLVPCITIHNNSRLVCNVTLKITVSMP